MGYTPPRTQLEVLVSTTRRSHEHGGRRSCGHGSVPLLVSSVRVVCVALWVHRAGRRPTGKGREQQGVVGPPTRCSLGAGIQTTNKH